MKKEILTLTLLASMASLPAFAGNMHSNQNGTRDTYNRTPTAMEEQRMEDRKRERDSEIRRPAETKSEMRKTRSTKRRMDHDSKHLED